ncbi:MAG: hypothetical protein ACE5JB_00045 [bacterium]
MKRTFRINEKLLLALFFVGLNIGIVINKNAIGQENLNSLKESDSDSLLKDSWSEETYYWIEKLRLERWLKDNSQDLIDSALLKEVVRIKKEAEVFASKSDFTMAGLWLETIWDLIQPEPDSITSEDEVDIDYFSDLESDFSINNSNKFNWSRELVTGVDLWRQEFVYAFVQRDSTLLEGNGNPYTGIRLNFDYSTSYQNSIQGYTFFKYSRDYIFGEANFRLIKPINNNLNWKLENRIEGTSFNHDLDLKYIQNSSLLAFNLRNIGVLALEFEDEFLLRRYDKESSTYPNYFNNTFKGLAKLATSISSIIGAGYRNTQRFHPNFIENDYQENRFDITLFQTIENSSSLSLENQLRLRNYTNIPADTSFQFDYWEEYFSGNLRLSFSSTFGTEFQGSITKRNYQLESATTPDYLLWEVEPEIYFDLGSEWRISAGFFYSRQTHEKLFNHLAAVTTNADLSIPFEDFYTYGPTFTIEFFRIDGLLFSVRESFFMERYPNFSTRDIQRFNLYSNRNINSIFFFLTWNISPSWNLGVLANMDDDRSQKDTSGDSQNTIVGIEFNYSF